MTVANVNRDENLETLMMMILVFMKALCQHCDGRWADARTQRKACAFSCEGDRLYANALSQGKSLQGNTNAM